MYVINISGDYEYLEATYKHRGVNHPACVCKTDQGVAFINDGGLFLYTGSEIVKLNEGKIDLGWVHASHTILNDPDPAMILSYNSSQHELWATVKTFTGGALSTNQENGSTFIYHFKTQSFSKIRRFQNAYPGREDLVRKLDIKEI